MSPGPACSWDPLLKSSPSRTPAGLPAERAWQRLPAGLGPTPRALLPVRAEHVLAGPVADQPSPAVRFGGRSAKGRLIARPRSGRSDAECVGRWGRLQVAAKAPLFPEDVVLGEEEKRKLHKRSCGRAACAAGGARFAVPTCATLPALQETSLCVGALGSGRSVALFKETDSPVGFGAPKTGVVRF